MVLPWRVPVWQQGPPHSILIVIKGRGTGLALCKCGMATWELRWSWNGGPTDLSRTQLGYRLCCVRLFLAGGDKTLAQPGVSPPVGAAMEPPFGGEVVYADQANGPLRVWPEVQLGTCPRFGERTDEVTHVEVRK